MIKKLRKNFIIVTMCSTLAVLVIIIGILNIVSYRNVVRKADAILSMLAENDAAFPEDVFGGRPEKPEKKERPEMVGPKPPMSVEFRDVFGGADGLSAETPYETRFFSVQMDESGEVLTVDTGRVAALETEEAAQYARKVWESGKTKGFYNHYRYLAVMKENGRTIIFVDRNRELSSFKTTAVTSVSVSVLGVLAVFILVVILSKRVFAPIADSYEKQKRFITDASHELKTPLAIISANVEILELDGENNYTQSIHHQVERLTSLTEQMVALSRMDEGSQTAEFADFSLSDAVEETAGLFSPIAQSQEKKLEFQVESPCRYHGDERLIRQMVSLLVDNAMKYSSEKGTIKVTLKRKGRKYQFSVWNTVDEIEKGNHDILFERFYRRDASRNSQTGGSGIGLSIVKSIVELHKGKITANSEDGKSLAFTALL
ncbi:MAG: HAMP domain-containing histidine kinase [Lachnospiraceae bacterium]|nr:HAMP domain-containing histidine kinase [Lachnospiraceae bacterium]